MKQLQPNNIKVLLFLAEGFEDLEAVSIMDIMGWTQYREWVPTVEVVTTGFRKKIRSRFGLIMKSDITFNDIDPSEYDALAIPGGFHSHGFDEAYDDRLRDLVKIVHNQGGWLATFCVGVLPVAETGLLNNKQAVTYPYSQNHDNLGRLQQLGVQVMDSSIVIDDHIISCQGPGSSLQVSYRLLEELIGKKDAKEVQRLMCFE